MKILFISFEFPFIKTPQSIRWNELLTRAIVAGHDVSVFSPPENPKNSFFDKNFNHHPLIKTLAPPKISAPEICTTRKSKEYIGLGGRLFRALKARAKASIPFDKSFIWALKSRKILLDILERESFDIVISSSPPFGPLFLGNYLKNKFNDNIKHIADLGDPWSFASDRKLSSLMFSLVAYLERHCLGKADWILVTTRRTLEKYRDLGIIGSTQNTTVIYQAADIQTCPVQDASHDLVYTGMFYEGIREPFNLYKACSLAKRKLTIAGPISARFMPESEDTASVEFLGNLARPAALELQKSAKILVFIDNKNSTQLPGKIFEYMATGRPIICIGSSQKSPIRELDFSDYPIVFSEDSIDEILRSMDVLARSPVSAGAVSGHTWDARFHMLEEVIISTTSNISPTSLSEMQAGK